MVGGSSSHKLQDCPKTIVFCRNVKSVATSYSFFVKEMGDMVFGSKPTGIWKNRLVAMYHRSTHSINKEYVLEEFPKQDSCIRILFATIAFGMGVDIPDIRQVVHFGCARNLEAYAQETGRGGRDGKPAEAITLYHSQNLSKVQSAENIKAFLNEKTCRRSHLLTYFALETAEEAHQSQTSGSSCKCCDNCRASCECGNCLELPWTDTVSDKDLADHLVPSDDDPLAQSSSEEQGALLRGNLMDYLDSVSEGSEPGLLNPTLLHGLDASIIDIIVQSAGSILCDDDLCTLTGLQHGETIADIMQLIKEIIQ